MEEEEEEEESNPLAAAAAASLESEIQAEKTMTSTKKKEPDDAEIFEAYKKFCEIPEGGEGGGEGGGDAASRSNGKVDDNEMKKETEITKEGQDEGADKEEGAPSDEQKGASEESEKKEEGDLSTDLFDEIAKSVTKPEKEEDTEEKDEKKDDQREEEKGEEEDEKDDSGDKKSKDEKEVVTVEDDGSPIVVESKIPNNDDYYESLPEDEIEWYKENGPDPSTIDNKSVQCTACFKQITNTHGNNVHRHPALSVCICRSCRNFYEDGEWAKDEEGLDQYCRWCAQGGDLLLCDHCSHAFCKRCLQRNLGRRAVGEITNNDDWKCLICDPEPIKAHKALCYSYYVFLKNRRERPRASRKEFSSSSSFSKKRPSSSVFKKDEEVLMKTPQNFIDENISEAFETLAIYQKCLEDERKRWIRSKKKMDATNVGTIARNLRKIYAITKQNMDLLDNVLLQSYSEGFPGTSLKKLELGKNFESSLSKKIKKKQQQGGSSHEEFVMNGIPVTAALDEDDNDDDDDETFDPSQLLQVEFRESATPTSATRRRVPPPTQQTASAPYRVSLSLFSSKGKKGQMKQASLRSTAAAPPRKRSREVEEEENNKSDSDDSDIEILTVESDSDSRGSKPPEQQPKKRKPGPASLTREPPHPPPKKKRPGPKSKTMVV